MFDLGQAYLTKFWIDACGIGAGAVAGIFAFTKIFDAFMDPIAGSVIDNRKKIGKQGKFRPVMMISAIILGIMTVVTFTMPSGLSGTQKIIYAYAAYMIWGLVYCLPMTRMVHWHLSCLEFADRVHGNFSSRFMARNSSLGLPLSH